MVVGPANFLEMRHPTGDGHVAQIAAAMNELRPRKQARQQTEMHVVIRQFVHDAKHGAVQGTKSLQVPRSETLDRRAVQLAEALAEACALPADLGHRVQGQFDLPRGEDLGMAGQDLFDERRPGSRQPHDEDRDLRFQPKAVDPLEETWRADRNHPGNEKFVLFRVILLATLAPLGQLQRIGRIGVLGGLSILAPRVQDLGQAEVQEHSLRVRQRRFRQ